VRGRNRVVACVESDQSRSAHRTVLAACTARGEKRARTPRREEESGHDAWVTRRCAARISGLVWPTRWNAKLGWQATASLDTTEQVRMSQRPRERRCASPHAGEDQWIVHAIHRHGSQNPHPNGFLDGLWMSPRHSLDGDGWAFPAHPSPSIRVLDGIPLGFGWALDGRFQPMA